jgi:predicted AAA+ superfamily ATPase
MHVFYYRDKGECDFVVMEKNVIKEAIQVCLTVDDENVDRDYNGLLEAMQHLGLKEGSIVTLSQSDTFEKESRIIKMIPASEFLV